MDELDFTETADRMSVQYEREGSVVKEVADPPAKSTVFQIDDLSTFAVDGALRRNPDGSVVAPVVVNNRSEKGRMVCSLWLKDLCFPSEDLLPELKKKSTFDSSPRRGIRHVI